ncbi:prepilin-type N-terminal cleavage/methylation domain-containing protein [Planococcus sp. SSTMD024]|uniref:type IV pilus modification PilV family protein n=1 Tax=Planococcus sp. SSTMD024 TaxID=3242163 RepID=UPI00351E5558
MKKLKSQQGLTLVEVLAALVILAIVFVGIMTVFPQMTLFNNKTEAKLDTMNLARQEMANIANADWLGDRSEEDPVIYEKFADKYETTMDSLSYRKVSEENGYARFEKQDGYTYEVELELACTPFLTETETSLLKCDDPTLAQLHKIHLKIYQDGQVNSETYGYLQYRVEEQN